MLVRNRLEPTALCVDIKQAFPQIRISDENRDALRFLWVNNKDREQVREFSITRAVFGLVQSPFLLGATLAKLLESKETPYPEMVHEMKKCLYVDDLISGGETGG